MAKRLAREKLGSQVSGCEVRNACATSQPVSASVALVTRMDVLQRFGSNQEKTKRVAR